MLKFIYLGRYENPEEDFTQMIVKRTGMPEEEAHQLVLDANATDPTGEDYSYTLWVLQQAYKYDTVNLPDDEVRYFLESFHKLKNKSSWSKLIESEYPQVSNPKDINQYDINTLASAVSHALDGGEALSLTEEQKRLIEEGTEDIGRGVYGVSNVEALLYMSSGTGWNCKGRPEVAEDYLVEGDVKVYITGDDKYLYLLSRNVMFDSSGRSVDLEKFATTQPEEVIELLDLDLKGLAPLPGSYEVILDREPYRVLYIQGADEATKAALWYFAQGSSWCFGNSYNHNKDYAENGVYLVLEDNAPVAVWSPETEEFKDTANNDIEENSDAAYAHELLEEAGVDSLPSLTTNWVEEPVEDVLAEAMHGNESALNYMFDIGADYMLPQAAADSDLYGLMFDFIGRDEEGKIRHLSSFKRLLNLALDNYEFNNPYYWTERATAFLESDIFRHIHPEQILDVVHSATEDIWGGAERGGTASDLYTDVEDILELVQLDDLLRDDHPYLPEGVTEVPQEWKDNVALSQLTLISALSDPREDYSDYYYLNDRPRLMQIYERTGAVITQTNDIPLIEQAIQGLYKLNRAEQVYQSDLDPERIDTQYGTYQVYDENAEEYRYEDLDKFVEPTEPIPPLKALQEKELPEVDISQVVAPLQECFPPTILSILNALRSGSVPHEDFSNIWDAIPSTNSLALLLRFLDSFDGMEDRTIDVAKTVSVETIGDSLKTFDRFTIRKDIIQQIFTGGGPARAGVPRHIIATLFKLWFVDNTNYLIDHVDIAKRYDLYNMQDFRSRFPEFYNALTDSTEKTSSKNSITYICTS